MKATPQEPDRVPSRKIAWIAVLSIAIGVAGVAVSYFLDVRQPERAPGGPHATIGMLEQGPIESEERGISLRRRQEDELHAYRWRDRDAGIAEIPIDRAMQIVEARAQ